MEESSSSSQSSAEDDINYNNPSNNIQKDNGLQSEICEIRLLEDSTSVVSSQSSDQVDSTEKVKISPVISSSCKEECSKSQNSSILNYTEAQKTTLEKASCSHSEKKSRHDPQDVLCPQVNCPEKIIICLDLNEEMDSTIFRSRAGDKYTGLELAKRAIKMFVMHKTQMNPKSEFAFLIFHEESTMIHSFTSRAQDMLNTLDEIEIETQKSGPLNISHMFETVKENIELPIVSGDPKVIPPPYIVRVILVFGRSHCVPIVTSSEKSKFVAIKMGGSGLVLYSAVSIAKDSFKTTNTSAQRDLESSLYFFTDVLYIHNPPSQENKCEEIFHVLCELDHNGMSYIFEHSKYTPILNSAAKLLAHPLQRPRQLEAMYKIGTTVPTVPTPTPSE